MRRTLAPLPLLLLALLVPLACGPEGCGGQSPSGPDASTGEPDAGAPDAGVPVAEERCAMPLERFFAESRGEGARAERITSATQLIGGPTAAGQVGDYLLANDRVRVVIQGPTRYIGPSPYGGTLLDADLVHEGAGNDQLGEIGLVYNFARTVDPVLFEVLADGSSGGPAILAVSGPDAANDYLALRNQLQNQLGSLPVVDPYGAVPVKVTNYFILQPGESRVQVHTAFCNTSREEVLLAAGDVTDPGQGLEFFNGQACTGGFGFGGPCFGLDRMSWFGMQGAGVAYGYAPYTPGNPTRPSTGNVTMTVAGITVSIGGVAGLEGLLQWFNPEVQTRSGEVRLSPGGSRVWARDFVIGRDLGEVASIIERTRAAASRTPLGEVGGQVLSAGDPLPGARVTFSTADGLSTVFTTDAAGRFQGHLPERTYEAAAWAPGRVPTAEQAVAVREGTPAQLRFELAPPRRLTVRVRDAVEGQPLPAKATILCAGGVCPTPSSQLNRFVSVGKDALAQGIQHVGYIPPSGEATFLLPAGEYHLLVSRGPEYSLYPPDYPSVPGAAVDLRGADATVEATLARVLDTEGWVSADFHVHAVNSPDSAVGNEQRVLNFAAEGVDVLVATDHDVVTDFAPDVRRVGAERFLSTVMGQEVSTLDYGHYNLFPLTQRTDDPVTRGALDWAGGRGPTLSPRRLFEQARQMGARTIHLNHPRGPVSGSFTAMKVDTDTLATHADPADYRMEPIPGASLEDTRLYSAEFNAYEVLNSAEDEYDRHHYWARFNDWFTLLSRGLKVAGTGVSDTHTGTVMAGGYYRTFVYTGTDRTEDFQPEALSLALNALRASVTNGPFVRVSAARVDAQGVQRSLSVGAGEVVDPSPEGHDVEVTVDVQVPEYLDVTRIELYLHKPQDDARCPVGPDSPNATTTRVACGGRQNDNWPASGVSAARDITLGLQHLEPVETPAGTFHRWHVVERFRLPAPATDNWVVAFVYGSKSLFPLVLMSAKAGSTLPPSPAFAFTNPIFIDADGNGYDKPPFSPPVQQGLLPQPAPPAPPPPVRKGPLTPEEFLRRWEDIAHTH